MSENGEIYTAGKNFTLPPALTAWTNSMGGLKPHRTNTFQKGASLTQGCDQTIPICEHAVKKLPRQL